SASISRTRWPFAVPPIAGLHGMCATVLRESVQSPTCAPSCAAAYAASQPAWPAPMTITSNTLFANTEARENMREQVFSDSLAADLFEGDAGGMQVREDELL